MQWQIKNFLINNYSNKAEFLKNEQNYSKYFHTEKGNAILDSINDVPVK